MKGVEVTMAENSKIEWTAHTFNPWRGCTKVSAGCANCYAETMSKRNPATLGVWGDAGTRVVASEAMWKQPLKWNQTAICGKCGHSEILGSDDCRHCGENFHPQIRPRVFCSSLADVFEDRPELRAPRQRLFHLIDDTPNLDWLLLTKRPEYVIGLQPYKWDMCGWPKNVWLGTTVENQEQANRRIPELLKVPAAVRFLSVEPMLGPVDLTSIQFLNYHGNMEEWDALDLHGVQTGNTATIQWVICGGESGPYARPMHLDWARDLRLQCQLAGVPFFMKQGSAANWKDYKAFASFPPELQVRQFPQG
jgi:protein gp37